VKRSQGTYRRRRHLPRRQRPTTPGRLRAHRGPRRMASLRPRRPVRSFHDPTWRRPHRPHSSHAATATTPNQKRWSTPQISTRHGQQQCRAARDRVTPLNGTRPTVSHS